MTFQVLRVYNVTFCVKMNLKTLSEILELGREDFGMINHDYS